MTINQLIRFIIVEPVNLKFKDKLLAVGSSFCAILIMALVAQELVTAAAYPVLIASMGASAVILFVIPGSPLAQPWSLLGGHLVSAIIGVVCAQWLADIAIASACAVSGSIFAMLLLRCLHPPGAATALVPVLSGGSLGYGFVLMPVGLNVLVMLVMAIIINRWLLRHDYPTVSGKKSAAVTPERQSGISDQDLKRALNNMDMFMDVSAADLRKLLNYAEIHSFQRVKGNITCGDIMVREVLTVEYGTEVEEAWNMMHKQKLKAMPVIDRARRVIGIVTWNDFFKFVSLGAYENFQDKFRAFIRRTPDISTDKPESVGHIMSASVTVMPETTHIVELIALMSSQGEGYRQIPIVNGENRLVGMVYQANLIAALYDEQVAALANQL
ncbi:MAG: HPP family protein [Methylobacter sp.]|nr:HPP family protein [Methylobacter sp.]MDP2429963.1 HPP family protein [Methylobacter sp.]MDP3054808.1 HPP family protein [Methylobacter sp.]MDP3361208.1 HPP family protein [Methylobacter sp.]MDZ4218665.1 HPP family protein [Methylobacter sp.]